MSLAILGLMLAPEAFAAKLKNVAVSDPSDAFVRLESPLTPADFESAFYCIEAQSKTLQPAKCINQELGLLFSPQVQAQKAEASEPLSHRIGVFSASARLLTAAGMAKGGAAYAEERVVTQTVSRTPRANLEKLTDTEWTKIESLCETGTRRAYIVTSVEVGCAYRSAEFDIAASTGVVSAKAAFDRATTLGAGTFVAEGADAPSCSRKVAVRASVQPVARFCESLVNPTRIAKHQERISALERSIAIIEGNAESIGALASLASDFLDHAQLESTRADSSLDTLDGSAERLESQINEVRSSVSDCSSTVPEDLDAVAERVRNAREQIAESRKLISATNESVGRAQQLLAQVKANMAKPDAQATARLLDVLTPLLSEMKGETPNKNTTAVAEGLGECHDEFVDLLKSQLIPPCEQP